MKQAATPSNDEEINLADLWETIWAGRWFIAVAVTVSALAAAAYVSIATEWYKAEVVLAPADQGSIGGSLGGLGAGLGGLAALAGISLPSSGEQHPVAVLRSRDFARGFIEDLSLMPVLLEDASRPEPLDMRDAVEVFDTTVRGVTEDARAGLVRLSMRWTNAETAAHWANTFAQRLNDQLRQQAAAEAERNIAYLTKEMATTSIVALQQSLGSLLEAEMQKLLLARGTEEFAFKVIDKAVAPKEHDSPKRALTILIAVFGGCLFAILALTINKAIQRPAVRKPLPVA